ncbi:aldo/keto reductase [Lactococcus protaetiae]|uniref:Aldo/keto reductase n=1 Tax=Lactococcus protaetiae TaxID=2592653 RepID=A0A514Z7D6_9LACT|nr:aldo/keto reductase [Lactococcus protaetiae]MCL2113147.1 aldo/keto reductase [Streptococcaceae bacterium]QDK70518.1 aldo/keto reductase [Lactococcus protaetiae]
MTLTDTYTLNNGVKIPVVGFGTWQSKDGEEAYNAVKIALDAGYRHIDTAAVYGNEESVGKAIADSGIPREELFITTKLWGVGTTADAAAALDESLKKLGLDYVDLYLIHWPNPKAFRPDFETRNANVWKAMEAGVKAGKARAIGVSNFHPRHLKPLLKVAEIKPAVNQIMVNPSDQQEAIVNFNVDHNILTEAYSPLGTGKIFEVAELNSLATKYGKTVAQIVLRWSLHKGYLPLPKSVTESRIRENADLFDFHLSIEDIAFIDGLHGKAGLAKSPDEVDF